jgi:hypothetical protein
VNGRNGLAFIERKANLKIGDAVTVSGVPATLVSLDFGDGLEDDEEVVVAEPSEKERKAAKLKAMQAKLAAAGLAKDEESEAERKAKKLAAMREKLAAAGLAPAEDSPEPDAEAARKAAKLQAMREKLAAAGLPTPD